MFNLTYKGKSFNQRSEYNYVDLGQLCATHGKLLADWRRLDSTQRYLHALSSSMGYPILELLHVFKGNVGTWGHPLVAIEVARWISPEFGVWCNQHIKTLMEKGKTELKDPMPPVHSVEYYIVTAERINKMKDAIAREICLTRLKQQAIAEGMPVEGEPISKDAHDSALDEVLAAAKQQGSKGISVRELLMGRVARNYLPRMTADAYKSLIRELEAMGLGSVVYLQKRRVIFIAH